MLSPQHSTEPLGRKPQAARSAASSSIKGPAGTPEVAAPSSQQETLPSGVKAQLKPRPAAETVRRPLNVPLCPAVSVKGEGVRLVLVKVKTPPPPMVSLTMVRPASAGGWAAASYAPMSHSVPLGSGRA